MLDTMKFIADVGDGADADLCPTGTLAIHCTAPLAQG